MAAITSLIYPCPSASSTLSPTRFASGATPVRAPSESKPLPAMMPATCVPWPYSSDGWSEAQTRGLTSVVKSLKWTTRGAACAELEPFRYRSSCQAVMPESMTATPMPLPVRWNAWRASVAAVAAPVRSRVGNVGWSTRTHATCGLLAMSASIRLSSSATCAPADASCRPATPPLPVMMRVSGLPRNCTMTRERPLIWPDRACRTGASLCARTVCPSVVAGCKAPSVAMSSRAGRMRVAKVVFFIRDAATLFGKSVADLPSQERPRA
ncbi:MAG: hypothetical protein HW394_339 [Acidobacteria bacterium]|nr:hypothetical protein [Acidobacteriota bacterium]